MYLEVAWTTRVTPSISRGRRRKGVAMVLSTTSGTPARSHTPAIPLTSATRKVGLASVSTSTAPVSSRRAPATASASGSTSEQAIP
jgi:hypothetical protein